MIDQETFDRVARRALAPLGDAVAVGAYAVRVQRGRVFVQANYDAVRSHEANVWIGLDGMAEPPLEVSETVQTDDPEVLERALARAVAQLSPALLAGDAAAWQRALAERSERARAYTAALQAAPVYRAADEAWAARDFGRVHDLLNPIRDTLDATHRRRLRFAEKRLG